MATKLKSNTAKGRRTRSNRVRIPPAPVPSAEALDLLDRANKRVRERSTVVRHTFIARPAYPGEGTSGDPPLAVLMRASKGGAVRLKFYLAVLWQAGGGDERHSVTWPARAWAALLDLPDPERRGDRRIRDAIRVLEGTGLLRANRGPGQPIQLVLRRDDGRDEPYTNPGEAAHAAKEAGGFDPSELYVQLPGGFWTRGWVVVLSAPGVAMLLVMLMLTKNAVENGIWISPTQARSRFGLSEDTWTRGVTELKRHGLLEIRKKPVGEDFGWRRVRNTYTVNLARLEEAPSHPAQPEAPDTVPRRRARATGRGADTR